MARMEHARDAVTSGSSVDIMRDRMAAGWRLTAIEWVRESVSAAEDNAAGFEPVPFGLRVAGDCRHLEQDPAEHEVLTTIAEMLVRHERMPVIAATLNARGLRTREGEAWSPSAVFNLMPRVVESSPKIFSDAGWPKRKQGQS